MGLTWGYCVGALHAGEGSMTRCVCGCIAAVRAHFARFAASILRAALGVAQGEPLGSLRVAQRRRKGRCCLMLEAVVDLEPCCYMGIILCSILFGVYRN